MDKKSKFEDFEQNIKSLDNLSSCSEILIMKNVFKKFKEESDGEDSLSIIFHISLLWPMPMSNPGIKVSIRLKDEDANEDVASWDKIIHKTNTNGWELILAQIIKLAKEMNTDFLIVENTNAQNGEWLQ